MTATRIDVRPSDGSPYPVVVGVGILGELPALVPKTAQTVVVVHAEGLEALARPACETLRGAGYTVHAAPVPAALPVSIAPRGQSPAACRCPASAFGTKRSI